MHCACAAAYNKGNLRFSQQSTDTAHDAKRILDLVRTKRENEGIDAAEVPSEFKDSALTMLRATGNIVTKDDKQPSHADYTWVWRIVSLPEDHYQIVMQLCDMHAARYIPKLQLNDLIVESSWLSLFAARPLD